MLQIKCPVCKNIHTFANSSQKPAECQFCFTNFGEDMVPEVVPDVPNLLPIGLKLIYQNTSECIDIKINYTLLGREHLGSELFNNIRCNGKPVISRKHCSISFTDGKFLLKDEGSSNGTFYGVSKIDCKLHVCEIEHNSLIFLGKEAFLAQLVFPEKTKKTGHTTVAETPKIKKYRCNQGCGFETETYVDICPKCYTSNSLIEVTE